MNSQLIKMEAIKDGYAEGIALDAEGYLSEGSGENLFLVKNGTLLTPPLVSSVLPGITRDTRDHPGPAPGHPGARGSALPREMLYLADEVFFTGTAAEITPIRSVDKIVVGNGARGPVTEALQKAFFDVIECRVPDEFGWLTFVREAARRPSRRARAAQVERRLARPGARAHAHQRSAEDRVGAQGVRPPPEGRLAPRAAHQRRADPARRDEAAHAGGHHRHGVLHHEQPPEAEVQGQPRDRHRVLGARPGPLPLQRLPAARHGRPGPARHPGQDPDHPRAGAARRAREDRPGAARPDPVHGHHRLRQVHHRWRR